MENLDFGWEFALIALVIYGILYFSIAIANYFLVLFLAGKIKLVTDKSFSAEKIAEGKWMHTGLPIFLSAFSIYFFLSLFSYFLTVKSGHLYFPANLLVDTYRCFDTGVFGYIIGSVCVCMTGFSFDKEWAITGRAKKGKAAAGFFLWTAFNIILVYFLKNILSDFFPYNWSYPPAIIFFTYLFLRARRQEKENNKYSNEQ